MVTTSSTSKRALSPTLLGGAGDDTIILTKTGTGSAELRVLVAHGHNTVTTSGVVQIGGSNGKNGYDNLLGVGIVDCEHQDLRGLKNGAEYHCGVRSVRAAIAAATKHLLGGA